MQRPFLEREHELAVLAEAARDAAGGRGCVVLVSGEAGIGKSRLVEAAGAQLPADGRMLVGHCDDLATPRMLGPFRDLIGRVGPDLAAALRGGADRDRLFSALRSELGWNSHPTLLAIEDVHWADDATLDVLHYLVRRIAGLPVILMLTYRDDELHRDHPLHRLLGLAATGGGTRHLPLGRLTVESVRQLSKGTPVDADEVFQVTAGNPFFVSEVLASGASTAVPRTVIDAVLARLRSLQPHAQKAVEQLAVLPTTIERWLAEQLVDGGLLALSPAEERGLIAVTQARVSFRHELTRRAIVDVLPAVRRMQLNARALSALVNHEGADIARIVHHAALAGDEPAIARYGPIAARDAAEGGAHREAVAHYRLVLEHSAAFPDEQLVELLEGYAIECYTIGAAEQAVAAQGQALELRRAAGEHEAVGAGLRWLSRMQWQGGDRRAAECSAREAVDVLEPLGASAALAQAYSNKAQLDALAHRLAEAVPIAERAVAIARADGDAATLSLALNDLGGSRWELGHADGQALLEESLRIALDAGETDPACRAYVQLACCLIDRFRMDEAERYVLLGMELAERTEHLFSLNAMHVHRARIELSKGAWEVAGRWAQVAVAAEPMGVRCAALSFLGRIKARRGDQDAGGPLASAVELGHRIDDLQHVAWASAAAAEAAWLRGDHAAVAAIAEPAFEETYRRGASTMWPELGYWLMKSGRRVEVTGSESPYAWLVTGRWREAAHRWRAAGYRYEYAMALAQSQESADLMVALEELTTLGAAPLARIVRQRLRDLGVRRVPRGPATTTRENPAGLTARQLEVLRLLADGLTDAEIAERLVISVRTAGNHVAAVLHKLGVRRRTEAAQRALHLDR